MMLFDPQLVLLGSSAYVILDLFGETGYVLWALVYPLLLGLVSAATGYFLFRRGDLVWPFFFQARSLRLSQTTTH